MTKYSIFYYPYATFKGEQELLLKAAALYFDKLYILDPSKVNWARIGQSPLSNDLDLAIISPEMPMEEILQYRYDNEKHPEQAREELGWLAHEIREKPCDWKFADELDIGVILKIHRIIWLSFSVTLLLPVAVATGVLGLLDGSVIPGAELALDWKNGRQEAMGNGLHYLMKFKRR